MWMLRPYLARALADSVTSHGVFLDVLGMGVLITGASGVGKSELALELISRGSGLVADNVVEFYRIGPETIEGRCPAILRDFLEVRGLGVLNIRTVFGEAALRPRKNLKLIVHLERPGTDVAPPLERLPLAPRHRRDHGCADRESHDSCRRGTQSGSADRGGGAQSRPAASRNRQHDRVHRAAGAGDERWGAVRP